MDLERRRYRITALSPLHIGSGDLLYVSTDYVQLEQRLFVFDQKRLVGLLKERGILTTFVSEMAQKGRSFNIKDFLRRFNLDRNEVLEKVSSYQIEVKGSPREFRPFIKTQGKPYIPGSSVKGALRVALLYNILKDCSSQLENILFSPIKIQLDKLSKILDQKKYSEQRKKLRRNLGKFLEELLNGFSLSDKKGSPNSDLFRCLKISDSEPLSPSNLVVIPVKTEKITGGTSAETYVEALKPGTNFFVDINIDWELFSQFRKENLGGITFKGIRIEFSAYERMLQKPFATARTMVHDLLKQEQELPWKLAFGEKQPNFRLGWGQGLLSASVFPLLPKDLRSQVRNILFKDERAQPAPLTRKVFNNQMMGFCWAGRRKEK